MKNKKSRIGLIFAVVVVLAASILISACTSRTPTSMPTSSPRPAGKLTIAVESLGSENFNVMVASTDALRYLTLLYDPLIGLNRQRTKTSTETGLVSKWETSADFKEWTFYLRHGIKFHNGDELTAEDVKFSIERIVSPRGSTALSGYLRELLKEIRVVDPYTVTFILKSSDSLFDTSLSELTGIDSFIASKKYFERVGQDVFANNPVGTGPYKFVKQVTGASMEFEAVDKHWRAGVPKYKTIIFYKIPEVSVRVGMLKKDEADIISIPRDQVESLKNAGFRAVVKIGSQANLDFYQLWQQEAPTANVKVRQALCLAIDRKEILRSLFAGFGSLEGAPWLPEGAIGYVPTSTPYDPDRARQLIKEAGYPQGFTVKLYSYARPGLDEGPLLIEAIAGYWLKIGVRSDIILTDYATFRPQMTDKKLPPGSASLHSYGWRYYTLPHIGLFFHSKGTFGNARDPELDALIDKGLAAMDGDEKDSLIGQAGRYIQDKYHASLIVHTLDAFGISPRLETWDLGPAPWDLNLERLFEE